MVNNVVLIGRITKEPELMQTQSGAAYVRFTLACNRTFKDQNGERQADFISCVAWRNQADFISRYIKKGNLLSVVGRIQTGSYVDNNNVTHYTTDVVVEQVSGLESRSEANGDSNQFNNNFQRNDYSNNQAKPKSNSVSPSDFMDQANNFSSEQEFEKPTVSSIEPLDDDLPF